METKIQRHSPCPFLLYQHTHQHQEQYTLSSNCWLCVFQLLLWGTGQEYHSEPMARGSIVGFRPMPIFHFHNTSLSLTSQTGALLFPEISLTSNPLSSSQKAEHHPCSPHVCPAKYTLALWEKASQNVCTGTLQDPYLCNYSMAAFSFVFCTHRACLPSSFSHSQILAMFLA